MFFDYFRKVFPCLLCLSLLLPMSGCSGGATDPDAATTPIEDDPSVTPPVGTEPGKVK